MHTKGIWKFDPNVNPHADVVIEDETGNTIAEVNIQGTSFAEFDLSVYEISREEGFANARLIAAAPDLLEALKLAVLRIGHLPLCAHLRPSEEWDKFGQYDFSGCSCDLKKFNAVIAKAEGNL